MVIIIGLGNPGEKFKHTRHNVGFMALDFFAEKNNFPDFALEKKYHSMISEKDNVMLVKPQTFMNESGKAVTLILKNQKEAILIVIHDDIDLPIGKLKIVKERGSAGHKGVESIIKNIGNENVIRFRVGIQLKAGKPKNSESFVIKNFTKEEEEIIHSTSEKITEALNFLIENGLEKTMNQYNGRNTTGINRR